MATILAIILLFMYGGLGAYVWGFWQNRATDTYPKKMELSILLPTLILHAVLVWLPIFHDKVIIFSFGHALNLITWLMLVLYWIGSFKYDLKGTQILLYPLAVISIFLSVVFPGQHEAYSISNIPFILHVASSILAYCLFGIATLLAVLLILLERDLHKHHFSPLVKFLPSLLGLEKIMFQSIWIGFTFLTISVISGTFFSEEIFGVTFQWSHKIIFGILSWIIYAILLWARAFYSWRGRKIAWWVIIGYISLMFAYIGSKFVIEILLGRSI